jgi:hypothetical protein
MAGWRSARATTSASWKLSKLNRPRGHKRGNVARGPLTQRRFLTALLLLAFARATVARADDTAPDVDDGTGDHATLPTPPPERPPAAERSVLETYYPPPVDGPELRLPESPTRLYIDGAYAASSDLSALQLIKGSGKNVRFSLGGAWRWHRFAFEAEIPFLQVTTLNVTAVSGGQPPIPADAHQTGVSFGDIRVGTIWTERLAGDALVGGFGLRTRLPTHSTAFTFHIQQTPTQTVPVTYAFPYYFHIEPTAILGGALGRFTFVINEGLDILWGPNGEIEGQLVVVPTIAFWDSHVAFAYAPIDLIGASVELGTDVQLNNTNDPQFPIHNIRSAWLAPAIQLHFGDYRVDLVARIGLPNVAAASDAFGVLEFVGTNSYTLRVGRSFN